MITGRKQVRKEERKDPRNEGMNERSKEGEQLTEPSGQGIVCLVMVCSDEHRHRVAVVDFVCLGRRQRGAEPTQVVT